MYEHFLFSQWSKVISFSLLSSHVGHSNAETNPINSSFLISPESDRFSHL